MRHRVKGRALSRTSEHRRALLNNMASSLFVHDCIETTVAKAVDEAVQRAGNAQRGLLAAALAMALERCDGAPGTQNQPE